MLIAGDTVDSSTIATTMMIDDKLIDSERLLLQGVEEEEQLLGLADDLLMLVGHLLSHKMGPFW